MRDEGKEEEVYSIRSCFMTLFHHKQKDDPDKVRNYHLVVATLIAAVTFQAGVNPPGGVWQENSNPYNPEHAAGRAIYASDQTAFYVFLTFNTLAFSSSMLLIICLTYGYPFFLEVFIAMVSMGVTYGASIFAITPRNIMKSRSLLAAAAVPAIARAVILIYKYVKSKMSKNNITQGSGK